MIPGGWRFPLELAHVIALVLCAAALGGCNLIRVGYGQLDRFAVWTAEDYFELDREQRQQFMKRFGELHQWHRYEELPEYVAFLEETRTRFDRGLTPEDFSWIVEGVQERYRVILRRGGDDAAAMLVTITPAQLDTLQRRWDRDNKRFIREHRLDGSAEEQREARARRALSRIRDWTGSLSAEQEKSIVAGLEQVPLIHGLRHEDRVRRQREFLQLMRDRGNPQAFAARLRHWLLNWEEGRDPRFDRALAAWTQKQAELYARLARNLTAAQRDSVARRIQGYVDDLAQLSQRSAPQAATR